MDAEQEPNSHPDQVSDSIPPGRRRFLASPKAKLVATIIGGIIIVSAILLWLLVSGRSQTSDSSTTNQESETTSSAITATEYLGDITGKLTLQQIKLDSPGAQGIAVDAETGYVYIGAFNGLTNKCMAGKSERSILSIVDPAQAKEIAAVETDRSPIWPAVDATHDTVYVAASAGSVALHKRSTGQKSGSISLNGLPHMPGILENIMVVSNTYDQSQTYYSAINLDTNKVIAHHKSPKLPHPIVMDEQLKRAYMMGVEDGSVVEIDMTTGLPLETFQLKGGGGQLALSTKLGKAITDSRAPGSSAAVYDWKTKEQLATFSFAGANVPGTGLAIDETTGLFFVVLGDQGAVGVGSLHSLQPLAFFKTGPCPYAVKIDEKRQKGYVTNTGDGTLTMFDLAAMRSMFSN